MPRGDIPTEHEPPPRRRVDSLVLVNTGDGKGKSTAAFGTVLRAVARGWPVAVVQFLKSGKWHVGEEKVCREIGVDWISIGEGFTWESEDLSEDEAVAQAAWAHAKAVIQAGEHRLVVLDEITYPITWGWIGEDDVVATIRDRPSTVTVICTGRGASDALLEIADTVTEMRKVKHAYDTGVIAKKGIDY
ncbi:MAG: cob(I)yrinic acid a,c-diamide adenosyltransferase [Actinomycetota bacterium]|nr:cob(I)yrinic acid a,c-diamide adenosyltransferase [Actinomycetota bacterium]